MISAAPMLSVGSSVLVTSPAIRIGAAAAGASRDAARIVRYVLSLLFRLLMADSPFPAVFLRRIVCRWPSIATWA